MPARYKHDYDAFRVEVLNSVEMLQEMKRRADRGAEVARARAASHVRTGEFETSIKSRVRFNGGVNGDRAEGEIYSDDPNAAAIEFGHVTKSGTVVEGVHALGYGAGAMRTT